MAKDTSIMEYTAEDLIAHKLGRAKILVAKPKFDQLGADLLGLLTVGDGAKFCRIQSKGRSLVNSDHSEVTVPCEYATDGFVLFVFVETGDPEATHLFCLFGSEVRAQQVRDGKYVLSLSKSKLADLGRYAFTDQKADEIRGVIERIPNQAIELALISGTSGLKFGTEEAKLTGTGALSGNTSLHL